MEVVYAARRFRRRGCVEEYLLVGDECVLGRTWYTDPLTVEGYSFNGDTKTLRQIRRKLDREQAVRKAVDLPEKNLRRAISIGSRYTADRFISGEQYAALVDALFGEHSIMTPFIGQGLRKN